MMFLDGLIAPAFAWLPEQEAREWESNESKDTALT
jgi:hypothetical protein